MSAALVLVVLAADLVPSAELEAKLATMEEQRGEIEQTRSRAWNLRIGAGVGYGLFAASAMWAVIELVKLANNKAVDPLGGSPYSAPVPPVAMVITAIVFGVAGVTLHAIARSMDVSVAEAEEDLEERERPLRRQLAGLRDDDSLSP